MSQNKIMVLFFLMTIVASVWSGSIYAANLHVIEKRQNYQFHTVALSNAPKLKCPAGTRQVGRCCRRLQQTQYISA